MLIDSDMNYTVQELVICLLVKKTAWWTDYTNRVVSPEGPLQGAVVIHIRMQNLVEGRRGGFSQRRLHEERVDELSHEE